MSLESLCAVLNSGNRAQILKAAGSFRNYAAPAVITDEISEAYISKPFSQCLSKFLEDREIVEILLHALASIQVGLHEPSVYLDPFDSEKDDVEDGDCKQLVQLIQTILTATKKYGAVRTVVRDSALFIGDLMCSHAIQEFIEDVLAEKEAVKLFVSLMSTHYKQDADVATKITYLFSNLITTSVRWCGILLKRQALSTVVYLTKAHTKSYELVGIVCTIMAEISNTVSSEALPKGLLDDAAQMTIDALEASLEDLEEKESKEGKGKKEENATSSREATVFHRFLDTATGFLSVLTTKRAIRLSPDTKAISLVSPSARSDGVPPMSPTRSDFKADVSPNVVSLLLRLLVKHPKMNKVVRHTTAVLSLISVEERRSQWPKPPGLGDTPKTPKDAKSPNWKLRNPEAHKRRLRAVEWFGEGGKAPLLVLKNGAFGENKNDHVVSASVCSLLLGLSSLFSAPTTLANPDNKKSDKPLGREGLFMAYLVREGVPLALGLAEIHRNYFAVVDSAVHFLAKCCVLRQRQALDLLKNEDAHLLFLQLLNMYHKLSPEVIISEDIKRSRAPQAVVFYINLLLSFITRDNLCLLAKSQNPLSPTHITRAKSQSQSETTVRGISKATFVPSHTSINNNEGGDISTFLVGMATADSMEVLFSVVESHVEDNAIVHRALAQVADILCISENIIRGVKKTIPPKPTGSPLVLGHRRRHSSNHSPRTKTWTQTRWAKMKVANKFAASHRSKGKSGHYGAVGLRSLLSSVQIFCRGTDLLHEGADEEGIILRILMNGKMLQQSSSLEIFLGNSDAAVNDAALGIAVDALNITLMYLRCLRAYMVRRNQEKETSSANNRSMDETPRTTRTDLMRQTLSSALLLPPIDFNKVSKAIRSLAKIMAMALGIGADYDTVYGTESRAPLKNRASPSVGMFEEDRRSQDSSSRASEAEASLSGRGASLSPGLVNPLSDKSLPSFENVPPRQTPVGSGEVIRPSPKGSLLTSVKEEDTRKGREDSQELKTSGKDTKTKADLKESKLGSRLRQRRAVRRWQRTSVSVSVSGESTTGHTPESFKQLKKIKLSILKTTTALQSVVQNRSIQLRRALGELKKRLRFNPNDHWKQWIEYKYKLDGENISAIPRAGSIPRSPDPSHPTLAQLNADPLNYTEEETCGSPSVSKLRSGSESGEGAVLRLQDLQLSDAETTQEETPNSNSRVLPGETRQEVTRPGTSDGIEREAKGKAGSFGKPLKKATAKKGRRISAISRRARAFTVGQLMEEYRKPRRFTTMSPEATRIIQALKSPRVTPGSSSGNKKKSVFERRLSAQIPTGGIALDDWNKRLAIRKQNLALRNEMGFRPISERRKVPRRHTEAGPPTWEGVKKQLKEHPEGYGTLAHDVSTLLRISEEDDDPTTQQNNPEVPGDIRSDLWMALTGAEKLRQRHVEGYYQRVLREALREERKTDLAHLTISKDVHRTLPEVKELRSEKGIKIMHNILFAYSVRNPETVGYCQSMNLICAVCLIHLKFNEEKAFWMLCSVVETHVGYYARSMCGLKVDQNVISDLVAYYEPRLSDHMASIGVPSDTFAVPWLLCLFVGQPVPLKEVTHIWDHLFVQGEEFIFQTVLAILRVKKKEILEASQYEDLMALLLRGMEVTKDEIINQIRIQRNDFCDEEDEEREAQVPNGLIRQITQLRSHHQWSIVEEAQSELDRGTISDLTNRFHVDKKDIHRLWKSFLAPSPWNILLHAGIGNLDWFSKAFVKEAFAGWHRRQWRGRGLQSGALQRLFETLDYNVTGQTNFEQYTFGIYILTRADADMRKRLAFEFCDMDADGSVSRDDLRESLCIIHRLYNGLVDENEEDAEIERFVATMFEFALLNKMTVISRRKAQFLKTPDSSSKRAISAPAGPTGTSIRGIMFTRACKIVELCTRV
ncbi:hypothetical protein AAMO2058_000858800 [Amorphochlora amoebiformis]